MSQLQKLYGMRLVQILGGSSLPSFEWEEGQTLAEYAMILALIAIACVVAVGLLGNQISSLFSTIGSDI
jgi:Flp pilus assembly pilin Flp